MTTPRAMRPDAPLRGKRVLITRAPQDAATLIALLESAGAAVLSLPAISIELPNDLSALDAALRHPARYGWIAFTSRNAVRVVLDRVKTLEQQSDPSGCHAGLLQQMRVAAIGPSTAAELLAGGITADCVPPESTAVGLAVAMQEAGVQGRRVLLPVGTLSRPELRQRLNAAGADVDEVVVYRTKHANDADPSTLQALQRGEVDAIALASPSAVHGLVRMLEPNLSCLQRARLACIGPTTAAAVRELGLAPAAVARRHTLDGLVEAVIAGCTMEHLHDDG